MQNDDATVFDCFGVFASSLSFSLFLKLEFTVVNAQKDVSAAPTTKYDDV